MTAHNHGSEDGPGLACPERVVGACMDPAPLLTPADVRAVAEAVVSLLAGGRHVNASDPITAWSNAHLLACPECGARFGA